MGIFDIFGRKRREQERLEEERLQREAEASRKAEEQRRADAQRRANEERRKREEAAREVSTIEPFVFNSTSHQRYQGGNPVMGLQQCGRTVRVEKNTNGCPGYRLQPGKGYIVKVFNDDLNKPNMSDKPMVVVKKTPEMVELRGFPIEAQTPFGWQEIDYSVYGFKVYYEKGKVAKCVLHMYDRNTWIEYRKTPQQTATKSTSDPQVSIKAITQGAPFALQFNNITVIKQYYNQQQEIIQLSSQPIVEVKRQVQNGNVEITIKDGAELSSKGIIKGNVSFNVPFVYQADAEGNEFGSAEVNNSFEAMKSGKEYVSLFQLSRQKGQIVSFIINNLPNEENFYYLLILKA